MRVLFFSTEAGLGGAERCLAELAEGLREREPQWSLSAVLLAPGPLEARLTKCGVDVRVLPLPAAVARWGDAQGGGLSGAVTGAIATGGALPFLASLRRLIAELRPDVVHSNGLKCHLLTAVSGFPMERVVWHLHDFVGGRSVARRLLPWFGRSVGALVANSWAVADESTELFQQPVTCIPNGVDLGEFSPGPDTGVELDRLAGFDTPSSCRVGLVATYARWKGHELFLEAFRSVVGAHPHARAFIVGGPIYRSTGSQWSQDELRAKVEALGLQGRVGFIPFLPNPQMAYRGLDLVVHASTKPEPFGRTIAEAMACGRAVIFTRSGGAGEWVRSDQEARSVPMGEGHALATAMETLVASPDVRAAMGAQARRAAERDLDVKTYVEGFQKLYRQLVRYRRETLKESA